jgi:16S rRNA C967 or C1407 C5-methylase (RsmB/RsmF family)
MLNADIATILIKSIGKYCDINAAEFINSFNEKPNVAIKINPFKKSENLSDYLPIAEKVQWCDEAYYLNTRPDFYKDPLFYAGAYYVMDPASMFIDYIFKYLNILDNVKILDIAAAPGGKSIVVDSLLTDNSILWANDISYNRAKVLDYNLAKWGKANYIVSSAKVNDFFSLKNQFDVVLLDAPCTGSGFFRKYESWQDNFSENYINLCAQRQKDILKNIFDIIPMDGYLIYSTCSYTAEENEDIAKWVIDNGFEEIKLPIPAEWGIVASEYGYRFFQHLSKSEGFYYAIFRKNHFNSESKQLNYLNKKNLNPIKLIPISKLNDSGYINLTEDLTLKKFGKNINLITKNIDYWFTKDFIYFNGKILSLGTNYIEENKTIPSPQFALSIYKASDIPSIALSLSEAQMYLQKLSFPIDAAEGIYLVKYNNLALGWIKIMNDGRINNYYPAEWRIIKEIDN